MSSAIEPFTLAIPESQLDDLRKRLDLTRWIEEETVDDWSQGVPLARMTPLMDHWRNRYDWRIGATRRFGATGVHLDLSGRAQGRSTPYTTNATALVASLTRSF